MLSNPVSTFCSVLKETLRASGANITDKHIVEASMATLFLLDAAKKVDDQFGTHRSSHHTTADATADIRKMCTHLLEERSTYETEQRTGSPFEDPVVKGMEKATGGWLDRIFKMETDTESDLGESSREEDEHYEVDSIYELHH